MAEHINKYMPQLTFLRFIAALLVIVFHYGQHTYPFNTGRVVTIFISEGSTAVSFFFFLSGLVLSYNYYNNINLKFGDFFIKRIARIYPLYVFAFIITLVSAMVLNKSYPKGVSIILQALALHAWKPGISLEINYPSWSIAVELFFYILFPALIYWFRKFSLKAVAVFVVIFWIISFFQYYYFEHDAFKTNTIQTGEFTLYFPLWHLNTFLFGMLCGVVIIQLKKQNFNHPAFSVLLFIFGLVLLVIILGTDNIIRPHVHNGLLSPLFFIITLGLATDTSMISRFFGRKEFVFLGNISYGMYMLQFPVFLWLTNFLHIKEMGNKLFYFYILLLMLISSATYFLIEKKFRKMIISKRLKTVEACA